MSLRLTFLVILIAALLLFTTVVPNAVDFHRIHENTDGSAVHRSKRQDFACSTDEWQCRNGLHCIDLSYKCDGFADCPDDSDEAVGLCLNLTLPQQNKKCTLPEYPADGTYITNIRNAKPGDAYEDVNITVTCHPGFEVEGSDSLRCINGQWRSPNPNDTHLSPKCVSQCHLIWHHSVKYQCLVSGPIEGFRACNEYEPTGTMIRPQCKSPIYYSPVPLTYMRCDKGRWDYIAKCIPECGTVNAAGTELVIGGMSAKRAEVPWHAAIYTKSRLPYEQICGGSIISNSIVISAAHCFWSNLDRKQIPASDFAVAAGKLYRPWANTMDEQAQKSDIKAIHLPVRYQGSLANYQDDIAVVIAKTPFEYNTFIRPVCVDFDYLFERTQMQPEKMGKVAGWGLTSENSASSQVLKVVDLPYVSTSSCITESSVDFRAYITGDKICAGVKDGSKALCRGDSGGGLAFPGWDRGKERYFLRGVVSTAASSQDMCNANTYTIFTLLLKHEHFIKQFGLPAATVVPMTCDDHRRHLRAVRVLPSELSVSGSNPGQTFV